MLFPTGLAQLRPCTRLQTGAKEKTVETAEKLGLPARSAKIRLEKERRKREDCARSQRTGPPSMSRRAPLAICHDSESSSREAIESGAKEAARKAGRLHKPYSDKASAICCFCCCWGRKKAVASFGRERQHGLFLSVATFGPCCCRTTELERPAP